MTDYMRVTKIDGRPVATFHKEADKIIEEQRALVRELEGLQEGVDRLNADIDEVRV